MKTVTKAMALVLALLCISACAGCAANPGDETGAPGKPGKEDYKVRPNEVSQLKITDYQDPDGRFSARIPEGWQVSASALADMSFSIHIFKPETQGSPKYHVYLQMKLELMLSEKMKEFEKKMFGGFKQYAVVCDAPVNTDGTVAGLYRSFNDMVAYMNVYEEGYSDFSAPSIQEFEVIEERAYNSLLKDNALDDKIIRATYQEADGTLLQGLFTGTVTGTPLGAGTYSVYNINFISAPEAEFIQYEKLLSEVFSSISISEEWAEQIGKNTEGSYQSAREIGNSLQATTDECNKAWEERNKTYDILSEKQSDATLGYERVQNTENGEIYKAYSGFMDDYKGKRLVPITDDMYALPVDGYIER